MDQSYRKSAAPLYAQDQIDAANLRAKAFEDKYRFARFMLRSFVALAFLIGMFVGAVGHAVRMKLAAEERLESSDQQREIRIVVTTPAVETAPARECFDGDVRLCPSANAQGQGPASASCHNGRWDPCAPPPPPVEIRLPPFNGTGFVQITAYDCETNAEVDIVGNQRRGPVYYVAHSNDGTQILRACPQASTQRLQEQVRTLDERLRRIEVRRLLTASELRSLQP